MNETSACVRNGKEKAARCSSSYFYRSYTCYIAVMVNDSNNINNTITSHLNSLDVGNPCPGLGQAKECGGDKPVQGIHPLIVILLHASNQKICHLLHSLRNVDVTNRKLVLNEFDFK